MDHITQSLSIEDMFYRLAILFFWLGVILFFSRKKIIAEFRKAGILNLDEENTVVRQNYSKPQKNFALRRGFDQIPEILDTPNFLNPGKISQVEKIR